jgi:hypothetical protein
MRLALRLAILPAIILLCTLTSCTTGAANSTGISGTCDNALYPVKQGAIWTYASAGGPGGSFTYTDTLTDVRANGFTLTSQFGNATRAQEWFCQSDGLKALQIGGGSAAGISTQGITAEFMTTEVTGVSLPREIAQGMQWQYGLTMQGTMAMPGNMQSPSTGTYAVTMQEMGKDVITVAAGVFEAARFQANSSVEIMTDFQGIPVPVKYNAVTLLWYAPNVGFIKSVENGDFGGTAFSITTELQSYNIP